MKSKSILLGVGLLLVLFGLLKPDLSGILTKPSPSSVVVIVEKPSDPNLLKACDDVIRALSVDSARKFDGQRLSSLYADLSQLISLDGDDMVIKNTEEIRQANSLSGVLLRLDMKGKYPELAKATQSVVVSAIGDDVLELDENLRSKASEAFKALSWACQEGSK